jgi:hypothetical protein
VNWGTTFGQWVKNHGVINLCRDLDVTKGAIYHWISGRAEPKRPHIEKMIELSGGALCFQDVCDHFKATTQGDLT